jgi:hypothetical protein
MMRAVAMWLGISVLLSGQSSSGLKPASPPAERPGSAPAAACPWPQTLDPLVAAPANHEVVLENERVRVLQVTIAPGERERVHAHCWPSVLYVMEAGPFKDFDANGTLLFDSRTAPPPQLPSAVWMDPQAPHAVENLDSRPVRLLRVELKR